MIGIRKVFFTGKAYVAAIVVVVLFVFAGSCQAGSGWQQSSHGFSQWVQKAHASHPDLAAKVDGIVASLNALHDEIKAACCKRCNNLAGTLKNARVEAEQLYNSLGGKVPYNTKDRAGAIFKSFNNFEQRIKWRVPQNAQGQEWYKRWGEIKDQFNSLKSDVMAVLQ